MDSYSNKEKRKAEKDKVKKKKKKKKEGRERKKSMSRQSKNNRDSSSHRDLLERKVTDHVRGMSFKKYIHTYWGDYLTLIFMACK